MNLIPQKEKFQSTLFIYEERNSFTNSFISSECNCFNPLSSFTKREINYIWESYTQPEMFQSTLFIYEERNFVNKHLYPRAIKFQSTLFIYEERNTGCFRLHPSRQGFNPLSSFTKREIRISSRSCSYLVCFNPLSSFTKREIA